MNRPHRTNKWDAALALVECVFVALVLGAIELLFGAGVCYAGFTGPTWGFPVCPIANPDMCALHPEIWYLIGVWRTEAACADMKGTFEGHHNKACHKGAKDCAIDGPGIAQLEGLFLPGPEGCEEFGEKAGWYYFNQGVLIGPVTLKQCKQDSKTGFGIGLPNFEQCFPKP